MKVLAEYSAEEIIPHIGEGDRYFEVDEINYNVHLNSTRLMCFKRSRTCVRCKVVGSIFRLELPKKSWERIQAPEKIISKKSRYGACYVENCSSCRPLYESIMRPHLNMYALRQGEFALMTQDHIIPKSKGGHTYLNNLQTMCRFCNEKKGNTLEVMKEDTSTSQSMNYQFLYWI
jgi:5-methylcytosine-specific restriction endonuclease McrA